MQLEEREKHARRKQLVMADPNKKPDGEEGSSPVSPKKSPLKTPAPASPIEETKDAPADADLNLDGEE